MVRQFQARVQNDGEYSKPISATNASNMVVLWPFSIMFSVMLTYAFRDCDADFPIRYLFDGKLFILRRLQAKLTLQTNLLDKLMHADYIT